jgi:hypothetical protein
MVVHMRDGSEQEPGEVVAIATFRWLIAVSVTGATSFVACAPQNGDVRRLLGSCGHAPTLGSTR